MLFSTYSNQKQQLNKTKCAKPRQNPWTYSNQKQQLNKTLASADVIPVKTYSNQKQQLNKTILCWFFSWNRNLF